MILPGVNILFKAFGVVNIFPNAVGTKKIINYVYRIYFLLILIYTPRGVIKLQYDVIRTGNIVLSTKVFVETVVYWSTLYVSYLHLLFHDGKLTWVKISLAELNDLIGMSRTTRRKLGFALWTLILTLLTCQIVYYTLGMLYSGSSIIAFISYFQNKFTVNLINYQFCYLLWIIRYSYGKLNRRLRFLKSGTTSETVQREIYQLKEYYTTLTCITKALGEVYSLHILFVVMSAVVETICSLNGLLFLEESCRGNINCEYNSALNSILWYCNFNVPVAIMVFTCSSVTDEARRTEKLVLHIELESRDEALISILEHFSLGLQLNRFTFTGYGCFEVDKKMLLSNASTALTYLIIQKQFAFDGLYTTYTGF